MKEKIVVICGPTASGKTHVAVALAKIIGAEIVSADSIMVYKELNIGSAKPTPEEMGGIKHHLIDILSVNSAPFCVAEYVISADTCVRDILSRNKRVIICGGTGLYIDHFMNNTQFSEHEPDIGYRKELEALPAAELHKMLAETDAECAEAIHPNNKKRVIRALEIYKTTGKTKSELDRLAYSAEPKYDFIKFALNFSDRGALYAKIDARADAMMRGGLLDEVRGLHERGEERNIRRIGAIGYVELLDCLSGRLSLDEAVRDIKQHTRNYAKRQLTWFKREDAVWVEAGEGALNKIIKIIKNGIMQL